MAQVATTKVTAGYQKHHERCLLYVRGGCAGGVSKTSALSFQAPPPLPSREEEEKKNIKK